MVNRYLESVSDSRMLLAAFLMSRGISEGRIMAQLSMDAEEFSITKNRLAFGLLFAGIVVRD